MDVSLPFWICAFLTRWTGRPLKIEIVYDGGPLAGAAAAGSGQPSLLDRIGRVAGNPAHKAAKVGAAPTYLPLSSSHVYSYGDFSSDNR